MKWIRVLLLTSIVFGLLGLQPQQAWADEVYYPTDDTFVRDKVGQRDTNFDEHADELLVTAEGFPSGVVVDIGYLRFDLSAASPALDVQFRLYNRAAPGSGVTVGLYSTTSDDWNGGAGGLGDETTLTFNNAPAEGALLDSQTGGAVPGWMEFGSAALATYVNDQIAGDGLVTLRVKVTTTGMADVNVFEDQENGGGTGHIPELLLIPASHTHWGESWSGTGTGLILDSTGDKGLFGRSYATTATYGVYGQSDSVGGAGVYGYAPAGSTSTWAVYGRSDSTGGTGLRGDATALTGQAVGVRGVTAHTPGRGVFGRADAASGTTYGVYGQSDSASGVGAMGYARATTGNVTGVWGRTRSPDSWVAKFTGSGKGVYISVPAGKKGLNVASGTKNAVVPTKDGARLLYVEEATEVWFADYGFGQLQGGAAWVKIDPVYAQTVDLERGYDVSLQAYGDAELYVSQRTPQGFVVRSRADDLSAGDADAPFSYRLTAKRLGYDGARLERAQWADDDPNLFPDLVNEDVLGEDSLLENDPLDRELENDPLERELEEEARRNPAGDLPTGGEIVPGQEGVRPGGQIAGTTQIGGGIAPFDGSANVASHDHWGETWTGPGTGLTVISHTGDGVRGVSTASDGAYYGVYGVAPSTRARAVLGVANATSGSTIGVYGQSNSTAGTGVLGHSDGSTGVSFGMYAFNRSSGGVGAYGHAPSASGTTYGVWGESLSSLGRGIYGYAAALTGVTVGIHGHVDSPNGWAGHFTGAGNGVYISVPAGKTGLDVASGTKNAVVGTADGARLMYAEEATEVWFADYGTGQLVDGVAQVPIEAVYAQTVSLEQPYHVFLQAYGDADLYVSRRTPEAFEVRAREGDDTAGFFFRIVAKRLGHEGRRLERAPWADDDPNLYPDQGVPERVERESIVPPRPGQREIDRARIRADVASEEDDRTLSDEQGSALVTAHDHWGELWQGVGADGLTLTSSGGGHGIVGQSSLLGAVTYGVYGLNRSTSGVGVTGLASSPSGATTGVTGWSGGARGAFGYATATSGSSYAVYGHSASDEGIGLLGAATDPTGGNYGIWGWARSPEGTAVYGYASHPTGETIGVQGQTDSPGGWAAKFTTVYGNGVHVSVPAGNPGLDVAGGTKNAVVATEDGARLMYAEEATEVWFADYGFGQARKGAARVAIDRVYAETVNLHEPYHVFVQVYGDARLAVTQRTPSGFRVRVLEGDPDAAFSYRVVAKRLGQEDHRLERAPWADDDPNLYPEQLPDGITPNVFESSVEPRERRPNVGDRDRGE
jgi:hypothetical protein